MPSLSSSIVNQQVASVRDVEEALSRQALYGGDLITNLLELSRVSEERLSQVLAESHELPPAPTGELPASAEAARRHLPGEVAQRFALYPLEERDGTLTVAVAEPLPAETEQDLSFSLGLKIVQQVALLVRVRQAIARDYDTPLDRRSLRVLARLSGKLDPSPSPIPSRPEGQLSPRPAATVQPDAQSRPAPEPKAAKVPPSVEPRLPRAPALPDFSSLLRAAPASRERRLGPFTVAMAERGLLEAASRDDILSAFFDFSSQYFDYAALFAVHGDLAEGRDAAGAGAPRSRIVAVGVPLDLPSAMSRARDSATPELTRLGGGGLDGALAKDLERRPGRLVLFLPIQVRGRTVLILYGDHGDRDVELSAVGEVISFAPLVANAFERLILRKRLRDKGSDLPPASVQSGRVRKPGPPLPTAGERAKTLASLIEERFDASKHPRSSPRPGPEPPPPHYTPAPTVAIPVISIGPASARQKPVSTAPSSAAERATHDAVPAEASRSLAARGSATQLSPEQPSSESPQQRPSAAPPAGAQPNGEAAASRSGALPRLQLVAEGPPPLPAADAPDIALWDNGSEFVDEDELLEASTQSGVPLAPASRSVAYSARPLPMRDLSQDVVGLPTVIVDLASDTQALVDRLLDGDASASDKLAQIGDTAITVLASIFPGPITAELRRGSGDGAGKASECGPVLRTLARMGTRPVPFVAVRTADGDPVVRAWATRLLGEMPSAEAAQAVARRLTDGDAEVQRAALAAGHMLLHHPAAGEALQAKIAEAVSDATRPEESRYTLIEALAELRAPLVIPTLVRLLEDGSPDIVRSAHWALSVIARQDFGTKAAHWEEWWLANSGRHRIEWLIDSLLHETQDLRRTAGDELKSLTKEYFGYYDDLPKKERERAQERYRKWWDTKGKARFR
jgi:hypothetical protein